MFRRVLAGLILGPALLLGSLAWSGYLALHTVFDEDRSQKVAEELIDNDAVRDQLAANLAVALSRALPEQVPITEEQIDAVALAVLDDPRVQDLVIQSFGATHKAFLGQGEVPQTIDLNPVLAVARERIAAISPGAAEALPQSPDLTVDLPTERIPDSSPVKNLIETSVPFMAAISVVMILLAFLTTSDRPSVLRRAARWAIGATAFYLLLGLAVPALLRAFAPAQAEVLAALITALLRTTLMPSIFLGIVGAGLLVGSWLWPDGSGPERERPSRSEEPVRQAPAAANRLAPAPAVPAPPVPPVPALPVPAAPVAAPPPLRPPPTTHVQPNRPQRREPPQQPVTPPSTPIVQAPPARDAAQTPATPLAQTPATPPTSTPRPTLPTRAAPIDAMAFPSWTGDGALTPPNPESPAEPKTLPPRWVDGHGWVLHPDDQRPLPPNARFVEGVGHIVPGPPPRP